MAVQKGVAERWKALTGYRSPKATACRKRHRWQPPTSSAGAEFSGTIGLPLPSTEIAIRDDDGKDLPLGEVGEICIRARR